MNPNITSHLILFRCVHTFYKRVCAVQFYRGLRLKHLTGSCSIFRLLRLRQNVGSKLKQKFPKELKTTVFSNNVTRENLLKLLVSSFLISSELCYPHRSSHLTSWVLIFKKKRQVGYKTKHEQPSDHKTMMQASIASSAASDLKVKSDM